jgi:hypothetical protein
MRYLLLLAAVLLIASPALAKNRATRPYENRICAKGRVGQTGIDRKGNTLVCKPYGKSGWPRWMR